VTELRPTICIFAVLALASCGGEDESDQPQGGRAAVAETETSEAETDTRAAETPEVQTGAPSARELARRPGGVEGLRVPARRARITAQDSDFGRVLFDVNGQVVYVFEIDRRNRSNCTSSDCVKAWPPVLTREEPTAGGNVDASLLGTIRRSDGMLQVTYNGRPLYFYEHEGPGEIKCHNVNLHGGLWWVVTPEGEPAE
jgi:predicted lipoprotein with Yx(FWY)xxD motif